MHAARVETFAAEKRQLRTRLSRNSRLCSRHFDQADILPNGTSKNPPKYFFWNNFGLIIETDQAREERNDRAARRSLHVPVHEVPCPVATGPDTAGLPLDAADCCPESEIGSEVSLECQI